MRMLLWLVWLQDILLFFAVAHAIAPAWSWLPWLLLVVWFITGAGMIVAAMLHAASKSRGGVPAPPRFQPPAATAAGPGER